MKLSQILITILVAVSPGCFTRDLWRDSDELKYVSIERSIVTNELISELNNKFGKSIGMSPDGSKIIYKMNEKWDRIARKYALTAPAAAADIGIGVIVVGISAPASMLNIVRDDELNIANSLSPAAIEVLVSLAASIK